MPELPSGTVAFLFADIEGSAALWEKDPPAMHAAVEQYCALFDRAIAARGGVLYKSIGDAIQAAFPAAPAAIAAALDAHAVVAAEAWPGNGPIHVRMGVHVGEAEPRDGDYLAPALNRLARMLAAGHGGQILLSAAAATLARDGLPPQTSLRDLGVHRFRDLLEAEHVFQVVHPALQTDFPPLASLDARPNNLPNQPNPFIGRDGEIADLVGLLRDERARLVTVLGPGGSGKTRLALQVAAELLDAFSDGVFFVPLASVTEAALAPVTIAAALALRESADQSPRDLLLATLANKQMLLVLDNLEQIPDIAPFIVELIAATSQVSILATSRAPLHLRGEREYLVLPLPLPPADFPLTAVDASRFDAVQLFVERARAIKPGFSLGDDDAAAVGEIVCRLDGLPLAIELAAARIRLFTPRAMLARLEKRLPPLTGGARDLPARQRALRATIAWSFDLLHPDEQVLFRRLSIFAGGFTLDGAELVADLAHGLDVVPGLERLVEHSLVQSVARMPDQPRFRMLETIREFGQERLDEAGERSSVGGSFAHSVLDLAEEAEIALGGSEPEAWLDRIEVEHDNVRAALNWAIDLPEGELALRLTAAMSTFWEIRGYYAEGRSWLERVLARGVGEPKAALAAVLSGAGSIARLQGDAGLATEHLERALVLWQEIGDQREVALVLTALGHVAERQGNLTRAGERFAEALEIGRELGDRSLAGIALIDLGIVADQGGDYAVAVRHYDEALAIFRELGDRRRESIALDNLGNVVRVQGDLAKAAHTYEEAIAVSRELGDVWGVAGTLGNLGLVAQQERDLDRARTYFEESLEGFRVLGDRRGMANALDNLGLVAREAGDLARAAALHGEGLELAQELGDHIGVAFGLEGMAAVADAAGKPGAMVRLFAAADALRVTLGSPRPPDNQDEFDEIITPARAQFGEDRFAEVWQAGRSLSMDAAIAESLALARMIAGDP